MTPKSGANHALSGTPPQGEGGRAGGSQSQVLNKSLPHHNSLCPRQTTKAHHPPPSKAAPTTLATCPGCNANECLWTITLPPCTGPNAPSPSIPASGGLAIKATTTSPSTSTVVESAASAWTAFVSQSNN